MEPLESEQVLKEKPIPDKGMGLLGESEGFKPSSSYASPSAVRWLQCQRVRRWRVLVLIGGCRVGRLLKRKVLGYI